MSSVQRDKFLGLLRSALLEDSFIKLTLGHYRGSDPTLENVAVRRLALQHGPHLSFLWRHKRQHITKNFPLEAGLREVETLLGGDFLDAHLFATTSNAQLRTLADGRLRLHVEAIAPRPAGSQQHDATRAYTIDVKSPWLHALGVTNPSGQPREGMADKFRQIQKYAEILRHLIEEAGFPPGHIVRVADMGAGKGYLTFAIASLLGDRANVCGIEARPELVDTCNRIASAEDFSSRLGFVAGTIASTELRELDVLIALHACDTATDDALAKGLAADARLLVVSPCCQKELRPQLSAPPVLADALQHGIFQERQAEFVTDALRAQLLEWAGYSTKVFEFISTEHTAKNLMITARKIQPRQAADGPLADRIRTFARFYGIRSQALAAHLGFSLL